MDRYQQGEYLQRNPDWHEGDSLWKSGHILELLKKNRLAPASVCEVGCGAGGILAHMSRVLQPGTRFIGYDISPDAIAKCQKHAGDNLCFVQGDFFAVINQHYDVLMLIDVVEHVEDYMGFIRQAGKSGHHKIFHFPLELTVNKAARKGAFNKSRERLGHLHYFSKETALATLEECGHDIIDYFYTNSLDVPGQSLMTRLLKPIIKLNFWINPDFAARFWGGYSLIVLTR